MKENKVSDSTLRKEIKMGESITKLKFKTGEKERGNKRDMYTTNISIFRPALRQSTGGGENDGRSVTRDNSLTTTPSTRRLDLVGVEVIRNELQ